MKILRRSIHGNTLIDIDSIKRQERLHKITSAFGTIECPKLPSYPIELDQDALSFYRDTYRYNGNQALGQSSIQQYLIEASILNTCKTIYDNHAKIRIECNKKPVIKWVTLECIRFLVEIQDIYPHRLPKSEKRFSQLLKKWINNKDYQLLINNNIGKTNAEKLNEDSKQWLVARYASCFNKVTLFQLFIEYNQRAKAEGWKELKSDRTIEIYLNRPEVKSLWFNSRHGSLLAKEKYTRQHSTLMPTMRDSLWYGDGTKLNLFYLDDNGKPATCNVYEVIDAYSECLLGYHISETENFEAQFKAFKSAMIFSGYKPYEIRFDNQGGHKKLESVQFFQKIARLSINTQPYNGNSKSIENVFKRFQENYLHQHWQFTGQNVTANKHNSQCNREFVEANKTNLLPLNETIKLYEACRLLWNMSAHHRTGKAREEMYRTSHNPESKAITTMDMVDMFGLLSKKALTYRSNGITMEVSRQKYQFEVLDREGNPDFDFLLENVDKKFFIGYDLEDMSEVLLFVKLPNGDLKFTEIARKYIQIHRNIQEQDDFDAEFIKSIDKKNKHLREQIQERTEVLLEKHGYHPSQVGLNMPKIRGLNKGYKNKNRQQQEETVEVGRYMKKVSEQMPLVSGESARDIW